MASARSALEKTLGSFLTVTSRLPGTSPQHLLNAMCTVALEGAGEVPERVPLEEVVERASQLAARQNPERPLHQAKHRELLWQLFQQLAAARAGQAWTGRRGHPTRFVFSERLSSSDVRQVFHGLGVQQPDLKAGDEQRQHLAASVPSAPDHTSSKPVDRDGVVAALRGHQEELRQLGVTRLSLFGSVARNEARADSDVDFLATFREPISSDAFFAVKFLLEDLLGRRVDLLTESSLRERVRRTIEPELVRVA